MKTPSGRLPRLLACAATLAALSVAVPTQAQDKKPINVLLPNENTTTLFPSIVARELGFFEDEGLDVTLLASDTTIPYVAFLMNNQADLVMLDAPQTFQAVKAQQPVAVVFEGMQYAPEVMIVREDSPIQSVADLKGKTIGLASDRDQITAQVALDTAGITIDVETVVVGDPGPCSPARSATMRSTWWRRPPTTSRCWRRTTSPRATSRRPRSRRTRRIPS